ncbi:MAG: tetratricopeptide repeat protein [Phormidium tanganyikae FI6-MK23]|jgi:tetratricopeptide (TPR) repeat protein|nr:tetratricopeptide repeat protein [Phormidium tanganyikae FI6-MK23]
MENQSEQNQQSVLGGQGLQVNDLQAPVIQATESTVTINYGVAPQPEPTISGTPQNLPYSGVIAFVGREQELEQIHAQLQAGSAVAISAIAGMGGIGKTELALQYACKHCREGSYPGGLCWIRAREEVGTQIVSFARSLLNLTPPDDLELEEKVRWCWGRWWEGETLLVLDDVQDYADVRSFLPPQESRFKVLMTSRLRFGSPVQELQLDVLSEEKALELLRSLVQDNRIDQQLEQSKQLCEWLGYLPLGAELVGRYLFKKKDLSIEVLWQRLQDQRLAARAFKQAEPGMTASLGVAAAFELSWQALEESAQQVAAVLSLFALVEIPWKLVEHCLPEVDAEELEEIRDQVLLGSNLLKRVAQGMYQLHQLLRGFFASKREQRADAEELQRRFYEVVIAEAERVRDKPERSLIKEATIMIAHLQATIERLIRSEQSLDLATCLNWIAELYYRQGRYAEAEPLFVRSLSIREQPLGCDHPDVASSLNNLANLYELQGRYAEAEPLLVRSLSIREQQLGHDHPNVALSLNNLAVLYNSQGRYAEAEPLLVRSLSIREQQLGHDHPNVALSLNSLGYLYYLQGRYVEAEPLWVRSLSIREQQLGRDHPDMALSLCNLAFLYNSQGRYTEAEPLLVRSLSIREQQLGRDHPDVVQSLNNLAVLYNAQGRLSEAEPLLLRSVSILQEKLPADHPLSAKILSNLALLYDLQGRYREAESLYLQALPILSAKLEESHTWRQEASQRFRSLLQKAIESDRTDELSDDSITRSLLQELQNEES